MMFGTLQEAQMGPAYFNSLTGGKVIMTWGEDVGGPYYAVIDSNGIITTPRASL